MKVFLLFCMLFSQIAYAGMQTVIRDASATNITTGYADSDNDILTGVSANNICCVNHLGSTIRLCLRANGAAACGDDWYMEDGDAFCFTDHPLANTVFIKSESGTISSGIFQCKVWLN